MGGTGRKRRGGKDCAKRKKIGGGKGEGEKKREKMCIEVFSCSNGPNLSAPTLQLTALPTTALHERGRERSHQCPEPEGGEPQVGASSAKQFPTALLRRPLKRPNLFPSTICCQLTDWERLSIRELGSMDGPKSPRSSTSRSLAGAK